jgi:putative hemolysin
MEENYSRYPVFDEDIDNVIGILHIRDLLKAYVSDDCKNKTLKELGNNLMFEAYCIPETRNISALFKEMKIKKTHMAVVVDEYGQTAGLITMEDILEEIVGNILDEYDKEEKLIARARDGMLRINGKALLDDVSKALDVELDQENYDTISGYLTEKLGHIPTQDDRGSVIEDPSSGYRFRVISITGTMFGWLEAEKMPELPDGAEENSLYK